MYLVDLMVAIVTLQMAKEQPRRIKVRLSQVLSQVLKVNLGP